jgi:hypothetical protein
MAREIGLNGNWTRAEWDYHVASLARQFGLLANGVQVVRLDQSEIFRSAYLEAEDRIAHLAHAVIDGGGHAGRDNAIGRLQHLANQVANLARNVLSLDL